MPFLVPKPALAGLAVEPQSAVSDEFRHDQAREEQDHLRKEDDEQEHEKHRNENNANILYGFNDLNLCDAAVDQEAQVFFIVQEALANVGRHSEATQASLTLEGAGDHYMVTVDDNGRGGQGYFAIANPTGGFEEHPHLRDHFGLTIMRERARTIGGRVDVANLPAGGFRVRLLFPAISPGTSRTKS